MSRIHRWADRWLVNFNPNKTESMIISRKKIPVFHPPLTMDGKIIKNVDSHKHLGLTFFTDGSWNLHITGVISKASSRLNMLRKLKFKVDRKTLEIMYFSYVRPILEYADVVWDNCFEYLKDELEKINYDAARIVTGATRLTSLDILLKESGWDTLRERRKNHKLILFHQLINYNTPPYLSNLVPNNFGQIHQYRTRNAGNLPNLPARTNFYYNSFLPSTVRLWNELPIHIRNSSLYSFKMFLKKSEIIPKYFYCGSRYGQILHTRLRTESSGLKDHLYKKKLVLDSLCICGQIETSQHFLLHCPQYNLLRTSLLNNLQGQINIYNLLYGNPLLSEIENTKNFKVIQDFILKSKRFT